MPKIGSVTVTENGEPYNSDVIWRVAPGADITKNAVISFSGSELASYVFFETEVTGFERQADGTYCYKDSSGRVWLSGALRRANGNTSRLTEKMFITRLPARTKALTNRIMANGGLITVNPEITPPSLKICPITFR